MFVFNRVILTGTVAASPESSYRPDGSPVIQFPLELDEIRDEDEKVTSHGETIQTLHRLDRNGTSLIAKRKASRDFIYVVAIGKLAKAQPDLQSGQHLLVIGRLHPRSWRTPEGRGRSRTEVFATDLRAMGEGKRVPPVGLAKTRSSEERRKR